ncbi:MAG: putative spermidine/putrescine transport system permease protein [Actinomycetota bacterium]|jgi:putative spermidine/putrescine transport system permease protein|nr:putative spermidine/putrescine transport system permease protein [Actinomycetota bacterium]
MTAAVTAAPATTTRGVGKLSRRRSAVWLGLTPFAAYVILFLAIPAVLAVGSGFFDDKGALTFNNLKAFADPNILGDFGATIAVSAVTAVVGAIIGAVICFALLGTKPDGLLRTIVDSASSVLAQFGGVMLAFAFIATIGSQGLITQWLVQAGLTANIFNDFNNNGTLIYQVPGLAVVYLYFQVPLMVLTFMPAMEGLKATWGEANATLGGTRFTYWTRIAMPILAPAFFGSVILLFANSFSSYATAANLIDQGGITPLDIRQQLTSETVLGVQNVAGVLAFGMVVIMIIVMVAYSALERRASRWRR